MVSEAFFETPGLLNEQYPAVYTQLRAFYRQDPLVRLGPCGAPVNANGRADAHCGKIPDSD